jgi:hypothetical protein
MDHLGSSRRFRYVTSRSSLLEGLDAKKAVANIKRIWSLDHVERLIDNH